MKKTTISIIIGAMFVVAPLTASAATVQELQAQIQSLLSLIGQLQQQLVQTQGVATPAQSTQTTMAIPNILNTSQACPSLSRNLWVGLRGNDVSKLQSFLQSTGDYTYGSITGYYGPATEAAVRKFQARQGIVRSGSPNTTGFGVVGPATRRDINAVCVTPSVTPSVTPPIVGNKSATSLGSLMDINSKDGIDKTYFIDLSSITNNINTSRNGTVRIWYPNGQLKIEGTVLNGKVNGLLRMWYENGQLNGEGTLINGEVNGPTRIWYKNGQLKNEGTFINDELDGLTRTWYENGQMEAEGTIVNGKLNGLLRTWYENGQLRKEGTFINETENGLWRTWYENRKLKSEKRFLNGKLNGLAREWYENGQLKTEGTIVNGEANGLVRTWHKNGQLQTEVIYVNGKLNGLAREWYENGVRKAEINYNSNGELDGLKKLWYADGKVGNEIYYKDGQRHGLFRYYDPSGYLSKEKTYINGNQITEKEFGANGNVISTLDNQMNVGYSVDQTSTDTEQMTNKFTLSGTAPQGVQSVLVALVKPEIVGSETRWQTIYERDLYRAYSGASIVRVNNNRWQTEFTGIESGNYFVYLYEGGVSQKFAGKYPLNIYTAEGYDIYAGPGSTKREKTLGLNQNLSFDGIKISVKDVRYSNGKTGVANVILLVEAPGSAPTQYRKTIGSSINVKKSQDTNIIFKVLNIAVPMKSVDLEVMKAVKG